MAANLVYFFSPFHDYFMFYSLFSTTFLNEMVLSTTFPIEMVLPITSLTGLQFFHSFPCLNCTSSQFFSCNCTSTISKIDMFTFNHFSYVSSTSNPYLTPMVLPTTTMTESGIRIHFPTEIVLQISSPL